MAIILITPSICIHAVMRMEKNNKACFFDGRPDGIEGFVVKTVADTTSAHDEAA